MVNRLQLFDSWRVPLPSYHACPVQQRSSNRDVPWWNDKLAELRKKSRRWFNRAKITSDWVQHNFDIQSSHELHQHNTRNIGNMSLVTPRTNYIRFGCIYPAIVNFNNLPMNLKQIISLYLFKKELKKWL